MSNVTEDLNATIANAVNARIEAEVAAALAGDEVIGQYVAAALRQEIQPDRYNSRSKTTFLTLTLRTAIQGATKAAVKRVLIEEREHIEDEVRKAIRRGTKNFAEQMVENLVKQASTAYGVKVELKLPGSEF